jgi:hypothetical protein
MGSPFLWEALHLPASLLTSGNAYYFSSQLFSPYNRVIIYRGAVFVNVRFGEKGQRSAKPSPNGGRLGSLKTQRYRFTSTSVGAAPSRPQYRITLLTTITLKNRFVGCSGRLKISIWVCAVGALDSNRLIPTVPPARLELSTLLCPCADYPFSICQRQVQRTLVR